MFYTSTILGTNGLNSADMPLSNKRTNVTAEYVENASLLVDVIDEHWCARHYRVCQYLLQIVKCE